MGIAGGGLQPSSQGVLLDAFPREKQGVAMTLFGFAALIAPVVGQLVLFPSYVWHGTVPVEHGERLNIAFDVVPGQSPRA